MVRLPLTMSETRKVTMHDQYQSIHPERESKDMSENVSQ